MTTLATATTVAAFVRSPIRSCYVGASYLVWCGAADLVGSIHWSAPSERDVREMIALLEFANHRSVARRAVVVMDCSSIERVDADVMMLAVELMRERLPALTDRIERHAIITPPGIPGLIVAGALPLLSPRHELRYVASTSEAFEFLAHAGAASSFASASRVVDALRGSSAIIAELRGMLSRTLVDASLPRSASALGMSTRSVQRELARCGTTFSGELRRARVMAAYDLLRHTDLKVAAIATRIGLTTVSHMNVALRRELGSTAVELRARSREWRDRDALRRDRDRA